MWSTNSDNTLVSNRYQRLSRLGAGAMGAVYRVQDRLTGSELALKEVHLADSLFDVDSQMGTIDVDDPRIALANEFQTLASLRHPNIISVLDYGFDDALRPYFTMTLLNEPQTLLEVAADLPLTHQIKLLIQLLAALAYIHRRGILHRDLKPNNVLVKDQHVYMLDFGLAIQREADTGGQTAGTLAYIAPEVLVGNAPTEAADLYAVGVIIYEMLSGEHPYDLGSTTNLINDILTRTVDVTALNVPEKLQTVLDQLLAKNPSERFTDAHRVIEVLCDAVGMPVPEESVEIRESFLQAATFVGRERELATLRDAIDVIATDTQGNAYLIGGESGVGKSRLLEEVSTWAMVNGVMVLRGQMASDGGLSYQLWRDLLRRLVLMVTIGESEAPLLKTLITDLPELLGVPVDDITETGDMQTRLLLVINNVFQRALSTRPILLILEDLHWATESLTVLEQLTPLVKELPLLIVGTYRNDERPNMPETLPLMEVLTLERLRPDEIEQLSQSMLGVTGVRGEVVELLQRETEGNVFFLVEVVRALAEEAGSLSEIGKATLPANVFAGGVRRIVQRRLERIPEWAQYALKVTAVAGRQLDLDLLRVALSDVDMDKFITVCSNAAVFDVQDGRWRFAHDKLREFVLDSLIPFELARYHRTIAEAFETVYADYLADYATKLVYHWSEAGNDDKEALYLVKAADVMLQQNEYREMKRLYERALELKTYKNAENPRKALADLMYGMGRATYFLSDYDAVKEWHTNALEIYRELNDSYGIAEAIAALGEILIRQFKNDEALPLVLESRELYDSIGKRKKVAYADMNLGIIYAQKDEMTTARDYFYRAYTLMKEVGQPLDIARGMNNIGAITEALGDYEEAKRYHNEALSIRRTINDRQGIAYSLTNIGTVADKEGDYDTAIELKTEALEILQILGEKMSQSNVLGSLGNIYLKVKQYEDAERSYGKAAVLRKQFGNVTQVSQSIRNLGNVAREQGDYDRAWTHYLQALAYAEEADSDFAKRALLVHVGQLLITIGQLVPATQFLAHVAKHSNNPDDESSEHLASLAEIMDETTYNKLVEAGENATLDSLIAQLRALVPDSKDT